LGLVYVLNAILECVAFWRQKLSDLINARSAFAAKVVDQLADLELVAAHEAPLVEHDPSGKRECPGLIGFLVSQGFTQARCALSPMAVSIGNVKIREWPRNPNFPAPEGPFLPVCAPVDHSTQIRSMLRLVSPRSRVRRRLLAITGSGPPSARWLRDQSRSRLNGFRS